MRKLLTIMIILVITFVFLNSSLADEDEDYGQIMEVQQGDICEFDGSLLNTEAMADILATVDMYEELIKEEVQYAVAKCTTDCEFQKTHLENVLVSEQEKFDMLLESYQELEQQNKKLLDSDDDFDLKWVAVGFGVGAILVSGGFITYEIVK